MFRIALTLAAAGIANGVLSRGAASAHGSPRYQDHFLRIHPSARNGAAAKVVQRRAEIVEHRRSLKEADELAKRVHEVGHDHLSPDERRRLVEAENKFGALYYAYGEDSSTWIVNGVELDYSGIDCDWVPGWQQKLDTNPDTDWSYSTTAANSVGYPFADDAMVGYESVCAGETTPQDPAIPNALPTIPCALICLPWQAAVSGAQTQTANDSLRMLMPAETRCHAPLPCVPPLSLQTTPLPSFRHLPYDHSTKAQTVLGLPDVPAAPLVLANDGYDAWYGYAAPDPYGSPPICETYIKDCTYSKEPMRTYTAADGSEVKWPRHDPFGLGDVRSAEEKEAAPDGVCSLSDAKTQWMDCAVPCPAPYEVSVEEIRRSYGVVAVCFMVVCSLLGLIALIKVGKDPVNYFVAGRGLPWWMIAATLGTTSLDAGVSMGALDYGYLYHWWDGAVLPISIGISQIVMAVFFAKPMFDMKLLTLPDLFAIKFGRANEMAFVVIFFISFAVLLAAQIVGAGKLISHVLFGGQSEIPGIWLCAFCIWLYTVTGGLFSVVYTDLVQGIFGWTGMMAGTIYVILNFPLAPGVGPAYPLGDKPMFFEGMSDPDAYDPIPNAIVFNWATIFVIGMGSAIAPDFQARIFAAKSSKAAIFGCIFGAIITWVFGCCWAFVPAAARSLYGPGSPHAEFVADSCNRHITVIGCFGPGNIETDPALNPGCTGNGIEGCDPKVRGDARVAHHLCVEKFTLPYLTRRYGTTSATRCRWSACPRAASGSQTSMGRSRCLRATRRNATGTPTSSATRGSKAPTPAGQGTSPCPPSWGAG